MLQITILQIRIVTIHLYSDILDSSTTRLDPDQEGGDSRGLWPLFFNCVSVGADCCCAVLLSSRLAGWLTGSYSGSDSIRSQQMSICNQLEFNSTTVAPLVRVSTVLKLVFRFQTSDGRSIRPYNPPPRLLGSSRLFSFNYLFFLLRLVL